MSGGFLIEGQNLKPGCQPLYLKAAFCRLVGLGGAMQQLGKSDSGNTKAFSFGIEPFSGTRRPIAKNTDADIGVEHEAQHQNGSRS